jgi:nicotinamide-nucleotide amidase
MRSTEQSNAERAEQIINEARSRQLTIATAESCTAGSLAHLLAGAPGASEVFHGGFIVYTKEQKTIGLGVPAVVIAENTAVSVEVAQAMAAGAMERSSADVTVSITGVLGPEPDEDGNPVGLVYFGLAKRNGYTQFHEHRFANETQDDIYAAVLERALILLAEGIVTPN